jgi:hypothetical protein
MRRDPHHFGKLDSDPHISGKVDLDPHQSGKLDPDPHQSENVEALEDYFGALESPNLGNNWEAGSGSASKLKG